MITIGAVQLQGAGGKRERKNAKGLGLRGGTFKVGMRGKGRELVDMIQRRKERAAIFRTYCRDKITAPSHVYEAAAGKLIHHMGVDCRRLGYDTVFMYWKSFHKSLHQR
ncbi:hypothetical protein D4764_14G0000350 [Takifugu flavidus]|uniref:Uncharacterized protein n=1 Tax=Takifugu flavidus TaxID=433684 RepID=A0A5C6P2P1_9TELE|nr:hypothetical protein D4764_14G0000350 [Takifugu flavidus]